MKITEKVVQLRIDFNVTPDVKRFVNVYIIFGKQGVYLIDTGVAGSEVVIEETLKKYGKSISDISMIFLTHAHPDHMGAAASIKKASNCNIWAGQADLKWIEDVDLQFKERPIPNFYHLLKESVKVDRIITKDFETLLEPGMPIKAIITPGHSSGDVSYISENVIFTGDAVPVQGDIPIFVDYMDSVTSLQQIAKYIKENQISHILTAWSKDWNNKEALDNILQAQKNLALIKDTVQGLMRKEGTISCKDLSGKMCRELHCEMYEKNPLFIKSVQAVMNYVKKNSNSN